MYSETGENGEVLNTNIRRYSFRMFDISEFTPFASKYASDIFRNTDKEGECLLWRGNMSTGSETPTATIRGIRMAVVKFLKSLIDGDKVPDGSSYKCTCGNKRCINPDHYVRRTYGGGDSQMKDMESYDSELKKAIMRKIIFSGDCYIADTKRLAQTYRMSYKGREINVRAVLFRDYYDVEPSKRLHLYNTCGNLHCINPLHQSTTKPKIETKVPKKGN